MRDHLIDRRPALKPEDDQWYLDRWTPLEAHEIHWVYREVIDTPRAMTHRFYRGVCLCGWRTPIEWHEPLATEVCPVYLALQERARTQRGQDRIEWKDVVQRT